MAEADWERERAWMQARIDQLEAQVHEYAMGAGTPKMWIVYLSRGANLMPVQVAALTAAQAMTTAMKALPAATGAVVIGPAAHTLFLPEEGTSR